MSNWNIISNQTVWSADLMSCFLTGNYNNAWVISWSRWWPPITYFGWNIFPVWYEGAQLSSAQLSPARVPHSLRSENSHVVAWLASQSLMSNFHFLCSACSTTHWLTAAGQGNEWSQIWVELGYKHGTGGKTLNIKTRMSRVTHHPLLHWSICPAAVIMNYDKNVFHTHSLMLL